MKSGAYAIVGLGTTPSGRVPGRDAASFYAEAARNAVADAGLKAADIDALCFQECITNPALDGWRIADMLGIAGQVKNVANFKSRGTSACSTVLQAMMLIETGSASSVLCVFADDSFSFNHGQSYGRKVRGAADAYGFSGAPASYAMHAARHMACYGTTSDDLGAIAMATRAWASRNPTATMQNPITLEDYRNSRWVAEPLRLLDCCLVSDGGRAVVVTSVERARDLAHPVIRILGAGLGNRPTVDFGSISGVECAERAFGSAGLKPADMDFCEIYDCFTITVLMQLEDFGFCRKGEGGAFVSSGVLGPGGALPTNTSGGLLSDVYMQGWTPLGEAITQLRHEAGPRQLAKAKVCCVTGNSATLEACLILARD
jgi:acetyl-CoA acetyltransferase